MKLGASFASQPNMSSTVTAGIPGLAKALQAQGEELKSHAQLLELLSKIIAHPEVPTPKDNVELTIRRGLVANLAHDHPEVALKVLDEILRSFGAPNDRKLIEKTLRPLLTPLLRAVNAGPGAQK